MTGDRFRPWLELWDLVPDGEPFTTQYTKSWLLPVRQHGAPAMLKLAYGAEEIRGGGVMEWWDGDGAAYVLAHKGEALLLERAGGERSLVKMAQGGPEGDEAATRIICEAVARLHAPRDEPPPRDVVPLKLWFRELRPMAEKLGGVLADAHKAAETLFLVPQDVVVLHGDIHHDNILDFGPRGWLAIDPKGLKGERGFDYANLFCNPDIAVTASRPGRLQRHVEIVSKLAEIEPTRLLMWILAYSGLSAAWILGDGSGDSAEIDLTIAQVAAAELAQTSVL